MKSLTMIGSLKLTPRYVDLAISNVEVDPDDKFHKCIYTLSSDESNHTVITWFRYVDKFTHYFSDNTIPPT